MFAGQLMLRVPLSPPPAPLTPFATMFMPPASLFICLMLRQVLPAAIVRHAALSLMLPPCLPLAYFRLRLNRYCR